MTRAALIERQCEVCATAFKSVQPRAKYCNAKCRKRAWRAVEYNKEYSRQYRLRNQGKNTIYQRVWAGTNREKRMLYSARDRAKKIGTPCTITANDIIIPTHCPVLGIRLERNLGAATGGDASPSLDRIIPELGYIPGNVMVISKRANQIKSNATPAELRAVALYSSQLTEGVLAA